MGRKDKKNRQRVRTFNEARKYLIDQKIINKGESHTYDSIIENFCNYKNLPIIEGGWKAFRKLLIEQSIIQIAVQQPKITKSIAYKKRKGVGIIIPDMSKIQVAEVYRNDLIKFATIPEKKVRKLLFAINKEIKPLQFIFQKPWTDTPTKEFYISDFYLPELKLTLEIDGKSHSLEQQLEKDKRKEMYLKSKGIETLRIPNTTTYHMDVVFLAKMLKLT